MALYLVQHGDAKSKDEDPDRPLTERGRASVRRTARHAARHAEMGRVHVYHSGKTRARETAALLAEELEAVGPPKERDGLSPLDDPEVIAAVFAATEENWILVGHLPHLARLAGLLMCGSPDAAPVEFHNGGIVALDQAEGAWSLRWVLVPDVLPA